MPKLSKYYAILAAVFFASSIVAPYIINGFLLILSQFASGLVATASILWSAPYIALLVATLSFSFVAISIKFAASIIKKRLFGFPIPEPIDMLEWQFLCMKLFVRILHHHPYLRVPEPDKTEKAEERTLDSQN